MKKFIWLNVKGKVSIHECEVSIAKPKPFNLKDDEERYVILQPATLKESLSHSFSFFFRDSYDECLEHYKNAVTATFESTKLTRKIDYSNQDVENKLAAVEFLPL